MPRWDLVCEQCGAEYPNKTFASAEDRDRWLVHLVCDEPCFGRLVLKPSAPNFKLVGAGFHKNDYPKSKS